MADANSPWEKIQQGVNETERLIGQKQYNLAMIKSRQTLEIMVRSLAEKACILDGDMSEIIDQLYEGKWISKSTREHYHKLRTIGNKAVHEGYNSASDANLAHHILSQEVYSFANEYNPRRRRTSSAASSTSRTRTSASAPRRRRKKKSPAEDILRILVPIVCVILLILIIRALLPSGESQPATTTAAPSEAVTMEHTAPDPDALPPDESTAAPEETSSAVVYRTTTTLNVRTEPSTDASILVQLPPDTEVNVTGTYDSQWTIINYDGQDAYVATAYLTQ